jgi:hypothetical protein
VQQNETIVYTFFPFRDIIEHIVCNKLAISTSHGGEEEGLDGDGGVCTVRPLEVKDEAQADLKNLGIQITVIYAITSPCLDD